jgi:hypothetical protein
VWLCGMMIPHAVAVFQLQSDELMSFSRSAAVRRRRSRPEVPVASPFILSPELQANCGL